MKFLEKNKIRNSGKKKKMQIQCDHACLLILTSLLGGFMCVNVCTCSL
jgi:hypothetical protein